ncbi:MAG: diacylglycerol kinase family protein [Chloroflexi bacterium]|nr:diacylglycerol kinase family protein [Chloroflexota bacterium]
MLEKWPLKNVRYAAAGLIYVLATQRNTRTLLVLATATIAVGMVLGLSLPELALLIAAAMGVVVAELINTAVESGVDLAARGFDPRAKVAKDVAACAVAVAGFVAIVVGSLLLIPRLLAR